MKSKSRSLVESVLAQARKKLQENKNPSAGSSSLLAEIERLATPGPHQRKLPIDQFIFRLKKDYPAALEEINELYSVLVSLASDRNDIDRDELLSDAKTLAISISGYR